MTQPYSHLCAEDRGAIMAVKLQGSSARAIGLALGRAPSTITRELRRNGYRCAKAGVRADRKGVVRSPAEERCRTC